MKNILSILTFFCAILFLTSWKESTSENFENQEIIGRWSKEAGVIWEIKSNGQFVLTFPENIGTIEGTYSLKDDQISLLDIKATGEAEGCIDGHKGIYTYLIVSNSLTINLVEDRCLGRQDVLPGTYNLQ